MDFRGLLYLTQYPKHSFSIFISYFNQNLNEVLTLQLVDTSQVSSPFFPSVTVSLLLKKRNLTE